MTLRKINIDNNLKYITHSDQTGERDIKPNTMKKNYLLKTKQKIFKKD